MSNKESLMHKFLENKEHEAATKEIKGALLTLLFLPITTLLECLAWGFVIYMFYGWFFLPAFPALPALTYLSCVGLRAGLVVLTYGRASADQIKYLKDTETSFGKRTFEAFLGNTILAPPLILGLGWFITLFI